MKVQSILPTPNPNAFKFVIDRPMARADKTRSYSKPEEARHDVVATGLFAVPGVETLFFCDNFVTVSMTAKADWRGVAEQVTRFLESHIDDGEEMVAQTAHDAHMAHGCGSHGGHVHHADNPLASMPVGGDPEMLSRINALLDDRVRPALAGDGGGLQVLGLDGKTLVIRYQGACGSCPSSTSGTMMAIQNLLQSEIDEELVVTMG